MCSDCDMCDMSDCTFSPMRAKANMKGVKLMANETQTAAYRFDTPPYLYGGRFNSGSGTGLCGGEKMTWGI